jgi:Ca2+-binding RTX toxin-like protein
MAEFRGTNREDRYPGTPDPDLVFGFEGNDELRGSDGNDQIFGNANDDFLLGGAGNDSLYGGKDSDELVGEAGNDFLFGNLGNDLLDGGEGNDSLFGGQSTDDRPPELLIGGLGNDLLSGDRGADYLFGFEYLLDGSNTLTPLGAGEIDTLIGGEGIDRFALGVTNAWAYTSVGNSDLAILQDFNPAEDVIGVPGGVTRIVRDLSLTGLGAGAGIFAVTGGREDLVGFVPGLAASSLPETVFRVVQDQ